MRPFWRSFWASTSAIFLMGLLFFLVIFIVVISSGEEPFDVEEDTVIVMKLDNPITERSMFNLSFGPGGMNTASTLGIKEIKESLRKAKSDSKIEGIQMNIGNLQCGMASVKEIRDAIIDFQSSDKFVIAYSESYSQKGYYLASVADEVYINPAGRVDFRGLSANLIFLKGMLDKLDVDMQIIRGSNNKFKAAVEPLMLDSMSNANRKQTMSYLNAMWYQILDEVGTSRGLTVAELNEMADSAYIRNAATSLEYKLVDGIKFEDEIIALIKAKTGTSESDNLTTLSFKKYLTFNQRNKEKARELTQTTTENDNANVAVIYANGSISGGVGDQTSIGSTTIAAAIRSARMDENIKGIVLRVNSPGGDAMASDVIWREVMLCKEAGKTVAVSMGDYAASGGYYISCAADRIFAQPNTITGSIGVFGIIPNIGPMLKSVAGITTDRVETNPHASFSITNALSDDEKLMVQQEVDAIYDDFISKVALGRPELDKADVDSIGQGRVWSGTDALRLKLVDELGGIDKAIAYVKEMEDLTDVEVRSLPEYNNDFITKFLIDQSLNQSASLVSEDVNGNSIFMKQLNQMAITVNELSTKKGVQAILPFEIIIE
ncbi:MAG: protease-4 [Flavobacteriales bacterium]|jgi:protease-4